MKEIPVAKFECISCKHSDYRMSMREAGELAPGECPRCHGDMKVVAKEVPQELSEQLALVARCFDIEDFIAAKDRVELAVAAPNAKRSFRSVLDAAKKRGYLPVMREREGELRLLMIKSPRVKKGNVLINLLLFFATIGTTFAAGYYFLFGNTLYAALFSGSLLFMLGSHELGHKIAAWHNGVEATLPYFIPAPTILGTFGAVISVKSPIPTKEALVEMGASGPLFGFFVALPITIIGLMQNPTAPDFGFTPAIFAMLQLLTFGHMPVGGEVNPLAFAGWVLLFVTMFNLFPVGQLDGGHVARGLLNRERHFTLTKVSAFSLIMFGFIISSPLSPTLWLWGLLILLIFRGYHTGALDDVSKLSKNQKWLAAVTFVVFLLCVPIPTG